MRVSRPAWIGALGVALVAFPLRFAARVILRDRETTQTSTSDVCGLTWRTTTKLVTPLFEDRPRVESESVLEDDSGKRVIADVQAAKELTDPVAHRSACFVLPRGASELRVYASGALVRTLPFDAPIDEFSIGRDGRAAVFARGELSIVPLDGSSRPPSMPRDPHLRTTGFAWLESGRFCWISAEPPGDADGSAQLFCEDGKGGAAMLAHAVWKETADMPPWVGVDREGPHLCGETIRPRDMNCRGAAHGVP